MSKKNNKLKSGIIVVLLLLIFLSIAPPIIFLKGEILNNYNEDKTVLLFAIGIYYAFLLMISYRYYKNTQVGDDVKLHVETDEKPSDTPQKSYTFESKQIKKIKTNISPSDKPKESLAMKEFMDSEVVNFKIDEVRIKDDSYSCVGLICLGKISEMDTLIIKGNNYEFKAIVKYITIEEEFVNEAYEGDYVYLEFKQNSITNKNFHLVNKSDFVYCTQRIYQLYNETSEEELSLSKYFKYIDSSVKDYFDILLVKHDQLVYKDEYGDIVLDRFQNELKIFIQKKVFKDWDFTNDEIVELAQRCYFVFIKFKRINKENKSIVNDNFKDIKRLFFDTKETYTGSDFNNYFMGNILTPYFKDKIFNHASFAKTNLQEKILGIYSLFLDEYEKLDDQDEEVEEDIEEVITGEDYEDYIKNALMHYWDNVYKTPVTGD